jgi:hypothetical protein
MKKALFLMVCASFALVLNVACTKSPADSDRTSFAVTESDTQYEISAEYNRIKISAVQKAVNDNVLPTIVFNSATDNFSKSVKLSDNTQFVVKTSPGKFSLKFDKAANSSPALDRVKALVPKIKEALN